MYSIIRRAFIFKLYFSFEIKWYNMAFQSPANVLIHAILLL